MKKYSALILGAALTVSSCTTGAGTGAYAGGTLGGMLGSAIGGILGGPHGSDIGTIFGMAGGAAIGGAMGDKAERQARQEQHEALAQRNQRIQREKARRGQENNSYNNYNGNNNYNGDNGQWSNDNIDPSQMVDNTNSGDDRITLEPGNGTPDTALPHDTVTTGATYAPATDGRLTIRNARFTDSDGDGILSGGEIGRVVFEIFNNTPTPVYNFMPTVTEADNNRRIYISPNIRVENIMPAQGLRYTATVKADKRIKDGEIRLMLSATKDGKPISYITVVKVKTDKKK